MTANDQRPGKCLMKLAILTGIILFTALIAGVSGFVAGHHKSHQARLVDIQSHYLLTLNSLEDLRKGDSIDVMQRLEKQCWSAALRLYEYKEASDIPALNLGQKSLADYRAKYRSETNSWSPVEVALEAMIRTR